MNIVKKISLKILHVIQNFQAITIQDEYLDWLCFGNAGMLHPGNLYCFEYAIQHLPSNSPIIEIGSFCGLSTNVISYFLQKYKKDNKIITADQWLFEGADSKLLIPNSNLSYLEYREYIKESYIRNINFFSKNNLPYTIEVLSDEFFKLWSQQSRTKDILGRTIHLGGITSFAYIDGNHTYEYAKRDFENVDRYLEKGGFILFDDSFDGSSFGCARLMQEIKSNPKYQLIIKNPNYLFQKIDECQ